MDNVDENASQVFICGPPRFNKDIYGAIQRKGISKHKIVLV